MAVHRGPARLRPRCIQGGSPVAVMPFYIYNAEGSTKNESANRNSSFPSEFACSLCTVDVQFLQTTSRSVCMCITSYIKFYYVSTTHLELNCIMTKLMHKFLINLSIYFCLTCFGLSFSPSSEAGVQLRQWFQSPGYGVKAWALTPYPGDLNYCRGCTPASENGLKESPKHVRQK
jgi:hypothetical protein